MPATPAPAMRAAAALAVRWRTALAACLLLAAALPAPAQPETLSAAQWREDLRFMATEMERRHKNLYHSVSREQFAAAVAGLDARIPGLQRHEIVAGMMRIAALVGDGHTRVDPRKDAKFGLPSLPLKLYLFDDGLYVRAAAPTHAALVGARVEAIGGVAVDEAMRRAGQLASRDNAMGPALFIPLYLAMPPLLHALQLSAGPDAAVLTLRKDGRLWTETVAAGAVAPLWPPDTDISLVTPPGWVDARTTPQPPLWLQEPLAYHRLVDLPQQRAVYAQLNMVADIEGQSLGRFGARIRQRAQALDARAIVLDLRLNQGGNGDLIHGFVRELLLATRDGARLFVLTGRGTFSASQFILDDLTRLGQAIVVGEPASSRPSSYGDAYRVTLPHSGISVRTSILWWQSWQNTDPWTWVDVAAPLSFAAYAAGEDPALEQALRHVPPVPLEDRLLAAVRAGGDAAVGNVVSAYRADPLNRYADQARALIRGAARLTEAGQGGAALAVAERAASDFPQQTDAWVVLAQLAEAAGRTGLARSAGMRALALDPNNRFVRSLLERLPAR